MGAAVVIIVAIIREVRRLASFADDLAYGYSISRYVDPATAAGCTLLIISNAFARSEPRRVRGVRAIHGEANIDDKDACRKALPPHRRHGHR